MLNSAAVRNLHELSGKYEEVTAEHHALQVQCKRLTFQAEDSQQRLQEMEHKLQEKEEQLQHLTAEYREEMDAAAQLAEKQNSLTMGLESQVG